MVWYIHNICQEDTLIVGWWIVVIVDVNTYELYRLCEEPYSANATWGLTRPTEKDALFCCLKNSKVDVDYMWIQLHLAVQVP